MGKKERRRFYGKNKILIGLSLECSQSIVVELLLNAYTGIFFRSLQEEIALQLINFGVLNAFDIFFGKVNRIALILQLVWS